MVKFISSKQFNRISFTFLLASWIVLSHLQSCSEARRNDDFALEREIPALTLDFQEDGFLLDWEAPLALETEPEKFRGYHLWVVLDEDNQEVFLEDEIPSGSDLSNYSESSWDKEILHFDLSEVGNINSWEVPQELIEEARTRGHVSLVFLIWAEFNDDLKAARIPARMFLQDVFPADQVAAEVDAGPTSVSIVWKRPSDLVSRVPNRDNGQIFGYNVRLSYSEDGGTPYNIENASLGSWLFPEGSVLKLDSHIITQNNLTPLEEAAPLFSSENKFGTISLCVLDGGRRGKGDSTFQIEFVDLEPKRPYILTIFTLDSLGNAVDQQLEDFVSPAVFTFQTTDLDAPFFRDTNQTKIQLFNLLEDPSRRLLVWSEAADNSTGIMSYRITQIDSSRWGLDTNVVELSRVQLSDTSIIAGITHFYDTLNYFIPDHVTSLRVHAIDSSGSVSAPLFVTDTARVLYPDTACPDSSMVALLGPRGTFCIDQYERRLGQNSIPGKFIRDVRASDAADFCSERGSVTTITGTWDFSLCDEEQWVHACQGEGATDSLLYGLLENGDPALAEALLYSQCNVGTLDSVSSQAKSLGARSTQCVTEDGVHDLSGHLQEWVASNRPEGEPFLLKGASWASSSGVLKSNLSAMAKCQASNIPVRVVPQFVDTTTALIRLTDGAVLLETDSLLLDTLVQLRVEDTLSSSYYRDEILIFEISQNGQVLVEEFPVNYEEYRRDSTQFNQVYFNGLEVRVLRRLNQVYIYDTSTQSAVEFHKGSSIGFRCCANLQ